MERSRASYHALAILHIDLVAQHDKGKVVWVFRCRLDQKLIAPRVDRIKGLGIVDIVDEDAAIGASVESHTKRLEALLTCGIP